MSENVPETHPDCARIDKALDELNEFFPEVQIFATRYESENEGDDNEGGTVAMCAGRGNIYARLGFVREWLLRQDERGRLKEREP